MPAEIQTGTGVIQGITANGAITLTGYATFLLQKAAIDHKLEMSQVKDATGFDVTLLSVNQHFEIDVDFIFSGATRAAATATAVFVLPFAATTLANFAAAPFNGLYIYLGGKIDLANTDRAKINLKLRRYADATQNIALSTTISG